MTTKRLLIRRPDGRYLDAGYDRADYWVSNPDDATPMSHYLYERDTNPYWKEGATVVEFDVTLTPTGRTCADLFKDEREQRRLRKLEEEAERIAADAEKQLRDDENARLVAATLGIDI